MQGVISSTSTSIIRLFSLTEVTNTDYSVGSRLEEKGEKSCTDTKCKGCTGPGYFKRRTNFDPIESPSIKHPDKVLIKTHLPPSMKALKANTRRSFEEEDCETLDSNLNHLSTEFEKIIYGLGKVVNCTMAKDPHCQIFNALSNKLSQDGLEFNDVL